MYYFYNYITKDEEDQALSNDIIKDVAEEFVSMFRIGVLH